MKLQRLIIAVVVSGGCAFGTSQSKDSSKPDNTKVNKRDRSSSEPTADQQKMNKEDSELIKKIRTAILDDKSLSTYAHNVKVISQNGTVTLRGPVHSEDEKKNVVAKAVDVTGSRDRVRDEITVKPK